MPRSLELRALTLDERVRARYSDPLTIEAYTTALIEGAVFPPIDVFDHKGAYIVADGFMRYYAHHNAGQAVITCNVHRGDMRAARAFAATANLTHGLRANDTDRDSAILTLSECGASLKMIAARIGASVSHIKEVLQEGRRTLPTKTGPTVKVVTELHLRQRTTYVAAYTRWCDDHGHDAASLATYKRYVRHLRATKALKTAYSYGAAVAANLRESGVPIPPIRQLFPDLAAEGWKHAKH